MKDSYGDKVLQVRIKGHDVPGYFVSEAGRVYSTKKPIQSGVEIKPFGQYHKKMSPYKQASGHLSVSLRSIPPDYAEGRTTVMVHRIVCEAFQGAPKEGLFACHVDGNPANNHNRNLIWQTQKDNCRDRKKHGRDNFVNSNPNQSLSDDDVRHIREMRDSGQRIVDIAMLFGLHRTTVSNIIHRRYRATVA